MMLMNVMMGIITMQMVLLLLMLMLMLIMMMMMMTNPRIILSVIYKPNKLYLCRRLAPPTPPPPNPPGNGKWLDPADFIQDYLSYFSLSV